MFLLCAAGVFLSTAAEAQSKSGGNRADRTMKLEVRITPKESGTVVGAGTYPLGTLVNLSATPAPNYRFAGWRGAVTNPSGPQTQTFINNETTAIEAIFELELIRLTVQSEPYGAGNVEGGGFWAYGSTCAVSATPIQGFVFAGWEGPVASTRAGRTTLAQPLTKPVTVIARFNPVDVKYTLTVSGTPSGHGTVIGGGSYKRGETVEIEAKPAPGFMFNGWSSPAQKRGEAKTTVFMAKDTDVTASFARAYAIVSPVIEPENAGTVTGDIYTQPCGIPAKLSAKPAPGYRFAGWVGDVADKKKADTVFIPTASETYKIKALFIKQ